MSKFICLLSCDGLNVDVEKMIKVDNDKVEDGVCELFKDVENGVDNILDYELDCVDYDWIERDFECGNEWNSIIVIDESVDIEKMFMKYEYNLIGSCDFIKQFFIGYYIKKYNMFDDIVMWGYVQ